MRYDLMAKNKAPSRGTARKLRGCTIELLVCEECGTLNIVLSDDDDENESASGNPTLFTRITSAARPGTIRRVR